MPKRLSPKPAEKLYKLAELEHILSVSRKTLKLWIGEGKLEAVKFGKGPNAPWRVSESAVHRFRSEHGRYEPDTRDS